ncbi:hypothetical protein [Priestia megaterium]|uniref:hypothetical protein n=1 Tax=Priestia megaterium TaxID=1404 RepID=UPI000BF36926|nr:hypothetical protein [Priestia megaterium]PFI93400.1 hypothetical protein COI84_19735 [Priestia megaterium]PGR11783.1 hypothetical protein COC62_14265 [Priestia megaterium]
MKWTNRDWAWLVGVLTAIIIFILTYRLSDNQEVTNLFSFISSSVSIALAIIAIFIALKQDSDGRRVNEQTSFLLSSIESKISNVDENVRKMDERVLSRAQETIESYTEEQNEKETYSKDEVKKLLDDLGMELLTQVNDELKRLPTDNKENRYADAYNAVYSRSKATKMLHNTIRENLDLDIRELQELLRNECQIYLTLASIRKLKNEIIKGQSED